MDRGKKWEQSLPADRGEWRPVVTRRNRSEST